MNSADSTIDALNGGNIRILLEEYLRNCHTDKNQDSPQESKSKKDIETVFPNLAGFCRFIGIGTSELEDFGRENPCEYSKILAVLEDEALNSRLSPTLVSAYLKKRLGYDGTKPQETSSQLEIKFEHDIFEDGE
jgi:hypothetical protein